MHTNDIHGHVLPENDAGGLAMIAAIVKQERPDLLVDAGDMFTGTLLSDTYYGEPVMRVMNRMGYRAGILGNHEFDYGLDLLRARVRQADFPVLSANVVLPVKEVEKSRVIAVKGIRFGIVGLTTDEAPITTHPKNMKNVQVLDVVRGLEQALPQIRSRSDFILVLGHLRPDEELRVARAFPEVRLIIGGHTHMRLPAPIREKDTLIVRTSAFGEYVGRVDLDFEDRVVKQMAAKLIPARGLPPDPDVLKAVDSFQAKIEQKMRSVIGEATAAVPRGRTNEAPLPNLIADAFRAKGKTQVAIVNIGSVRTDLPAGPITFGKIFEIQPFPNTLVTMFITGVQLKRSLAVDLAAVSGLRAVFDLSKPKNERLVSATLEDGSPIVDNLYYSVTINDFMQVGGDGYNEFAYGAQIIDTGELARDAVVEYITSRKTIGPLVDGRVQIVN